MSTKMTKILICDKIKFFHSWHTITYTLIQILVLHTSITFYISCKKLVSFPCRNNSTQIISLINSLEILKFCYFALFVIIYYLLSRRFFLHSHGFSGWADAHNPTLLALASFSHCFSNQFSEEKKRKQINQTT